MCGIIGYVGKFNAVDILLDGLYKLEYRGYDSSGIAVIDTNGSIKVYKKMGKIDCLAQYIAKLDKDKLISNCGIGHTRWATHGEANDINAHPHLSSNGEIAIVHNGIIENYLQIKQQLSDLGCNFVSQTDSEVIANLIQYYYKGNILEAVRTATLHLKGSFALAVVCSRHSGQIIVARRGSPLVVGLDDDATYVASDIPTLATFCSRAIVLDDMQLGVIDASGCAVYGCDLQLLKATTITLSKSITNSAKGNYSTYMGKEIAEIPMAVGNTYASLKDLKFESEFAKKIKNIVFVGCGTAYHASEIGGYLVRKYLNINASGYIASEYLFSCPIIPSNTLAIAISQSGETADTLNAFKLLKSQGCDTMCITNVANSTITRLSDITLATQAGAEIGVASTKAYASQLMAIMCVINALAEAAKGVKAIDIDILRLTNTLVEMIEAPSQIIGDISRRLNGGSKVFFLGRNNDFVTASEAALKLKEITYINAQAIASGELKHGTLALIDNESLVFVIATEEQTLAKQISNISEVKSRGGYIVGVSPYVELEKYCDKTIKLAELDVTQYCISGILPFFVLSLATANNLGLNADKPRNLAKSVTVE